MRPNRFFSQPNNHAPYYHPYQQPFQPNGFPPQSHSHMNHQPYPPPYTNMPFQQGNWQPPYQGTGTEQKSLTKGIMGYFQDDEGQFDFDKILNTAGQVGNTYQQFSPIVKGIGSFFKGN
ncbi:YppG family protein [Amphibacillus sp. Q70]|uniref:YppG family protein n=1 Tax=Amphibacillus sp. Q70 TaxID=3453416 RepID=UPI003F84BA78